ncbi:MAG: flagellar hook-basal body complex protein FliE [Alphaproteobacteria bacterium]|nr:flagellar hook-basal body complex protein FliE [Alphaproteobacteria bacterium]MBL6939982.1 flagellar hook-basal body complex protein FliE [Alphaproteobacteria bacterium]MBL7098162.1 flagellar hook-basal body complex protein FliE [Alphaproteobacteria bacterium]
MALPAAAATAYQAIANIGTSAGTAGSAATTGATGANASDFSNFLSNALRDGIGTMKQGETMAGRQITGQANIVDVVSAVNQAEITLDTVVAVRDKVVSAYQSIMNMPI